MENAIMKSKHDVASSTSTTEITADEQTKTTTPSVLKFLSYICLNTDVSSHVLILDTSVSRLN